MADELTVDSSHYEESVSRILATSKRDGIVVLREQARGIVRHLQIYTPPGHQGVTGQAAKKHGEGLVEGDIRKLVFGVNRKFAGLRTNIAFIHKENRNPRTGRVKRRVRGKIPVPAPELKKYIASKKKMVGFLASGWNMAAAKLGFKPPQWMWRHNGDGDMREVTTSDSLLIEATNRVGFSGRAIKQVDRLMRFAYSAQKAANDRRWKEFVESRAKKAGLKVK